MRDDFDARWAAEAGAVLGGFKEWRLQHPKAMLSEIEAALDERWAVARARLLSDAAQASEAADLRRGTAVRCPQCGERMAVRGPEARTLTTTHEQPIALRRHYAVCAACGEALSPPG
jgi:predicted RNA-binding Zn-ribbon protein involved in translation (DUF1610 family)